MDITTSNHSLVALRTESDSTSFTLFGSSQTMRSPPSPVAHGRRKSITGPVVIEAALGVLVAGEGEAVAPALLVPWRLD